MKSSSNRNEVFNVFVTKLARACLIIGLLFCAANARARPRDPWPPLPEFAPVLYHESFDEIYTYRMTNAAWVIPNYGTLVESWSAYALQREGTVTPFIVPGLDSAGHTNIAPEGALRLWVKPYWSSAPDGTGPGTDARVVELEVAGGKQAAAVWWLQVNPEGTVVSLLGQSDTGPVTLLKAEICWQAGQWHQLCLNYGQKETALYVDGTLAAEGTGTLKVPPKVAALVWGSTLDGTESIGGELEELYTFSRPVEVGFHYFPLKDQAALGPITPEEDQALADLRAKWKAEREARGEAEGGGPQMERLLGPTTDCITNVPVYITNIVSTFVTNQGWTVTFDIQGSYDGTTTALYDVFSITNLAGDGVTNVWTWLERGPTCSTYQYTNQAGAQTFYILGTPLDSDSDGLTDAYEKLVSKTNPHNPDTDGDGFTDGWEVAHGLNPLLDDSAQSGSRLNYIYDGVGWLGTVSGAQNGTVSLDAEGNVLQVSQ